MNIYAVGTIFVQLTLGLNAFITAQGFAKTGMLSVLIGAVINIVEYVAGFVAGCTAVIVGCKALFGHIDRQRLFCAWCKNTGLCKTDECAGWFSKNTLRSFYINLNNLFTIRFAVIEVIL